MQLTLLFCKVNDRICYHINIVYIYYNANIIYTYVYIQHIHVYIISGIYARSLIQPLHSTCMHTQHHEQNTYKRVVYTYALRVYTHINESHTT